MARYSYERLSSESTAVLHGETSRAFAHAGAILIFESGPLATPGGGVDFEEIRSGIGARLYQAPRYRQRLKWIPIEDHPVWVDDRDFTLDFHLRHTSIPRPGGMDQLKRMAARIMAHRLDRDRPLWECWVLEGLEHDRFAVILKTHHCMIEGATADLFLTLLSTDPAEAYRPGPQFIPRPEPSTFELMWDEVIRGASLPRQAGEKLSAVVRHPERFGHEVLHRAHALAELLGYTLRGTVDTPVNGRLGHHRRFDSLSLPLEQARQIRKRLGGTINDIVLATVAGAIRSFLQARFVNPASLDFRIATPVSIDSDGPGDALSEWILELPVWEREAVKRLEIIRDRTRELVATDHALGAKSLLGVTQWTSGRLLSLGMRSVSSHAPVNMTVTNVPGPQVPLYFKGARLLESYGMAPLRREQGLSVAVFSYDGKLCWGITGDYDLLPDIERFTAAIQTAFEELHAAAQLRGRKLRAVDPAAPSKRRRA